MSEQPTCGKGLAEQARLPAVLADVVAGVAKVLDCHTRALDPDNEPAHRELDTYIALVTEHRAVASQLRAIARHMESSRDLPMAPHDHAAMMDRDAVDAFDQFITAERALAKLLSAQVEQHQSMLDQMRSR